METKSTTAPTTAICFALAEEAGVFNKTYTGNAPVFFTGIGRFNAEKAVKNFLATNTPGILFTCGFAGGLVSELKIGDVVFEIPSGDGNPYAAVRSKFYFYYIDEIGSTLARERYGEFAVVENKFEWVSIGEKFYGSGFLDAVEL